MRGNTPGWGRHANTFEDRDGTDDDTNTIEEIIDAESEIL
jgi:hypothetical protein